MCSKVTGTCRSASSLKGQHLTSWLQEPGTYYFENFALWVGQRRRMTRLNLRKGCALKHHSEVMFGHLPISPNDIRCWVPRLALIWVPRLTPNFFFQPWDSKNRCPLLESPRTTTSCEGRLEHTHSNSGQKRGCVRRTSVSARALSPKKS